MRALGVRPPRFRFGVPEAVAVTLAVLELQRVDRAHALEERLGAVAEEEPDPLGRRHPEMKPALRADAHVPLQLLEIERLAAALALEEQPLAERSRGLGVTRGARALVLAEPHG